MSIKQFIEDLKRDPEGNDFSKTIQVIEDHYFFTPSEFNNGNIQNKIGENSGSCKIFAFAKLQDLNQKLTLACFGKHYFKDVLDDPKGEGHQNIRNFMKTGWSGIEFEGNPLEEK